MTEERRFTPEERDAILRFIEEAELQGALAEADHPHVLVSVSPDGGEPEVILGPFPDLWSALAYGPTWAETLNHDARPEDVSQIQAHRLYLPEEPID